jgi:hypothetical protein
MAAEALSYVSSLAQIYVAEAAQQPSATNTKMLHALPIAVTSRSVDEVAAIYFDEIKRTKPLAVKTELDRREALALLNEITEGKTIAMIDKSDAQQVKQVLLRLPKNRSKMPETKGKTLKQLMSVAGIPPSRPLLRGPTGEISREGGLDTSVQKTVGNLRPLDMKKLQCLLIRSLYPVQSGGPTQGQ